MHQTFFVPPRGGFAILADRLALLIMRKLAPKGDSPQLTHFWNNMKVGHAALEHLDSSLMVACDGDREAVRRRGWWDLRFHLGGWKQYVVLEPSEYRDLWHVGWRTAHGGGASQLPLYSRVRMLIGPDTVEFFGVKAGSFGQIKLRKVGERRLGDKGPFCDVPQL